MSAALGGALDLLKENLNAINFRLSCSIQTILQKNEFLTYFGYDKLLDCNHTTIKYLKIKPSDSRFFNNYIRTELLNRPELPQMSKVLKDKITEAIYELFVNAQMHSETKFIYTCGQFFPAKDKIEFTIVDTGIGIKERVNRSLNTSFNAVQAIKWAIKDKNTTKKDISGGIGLALLKEFVQRNRGKFQIISDNGFYQLDQSGEITQLFNNPYPGTIINVQINTDDNHSYSLMSEVENDDLF